ncbi:MAG: DnaJ family domain-containing protein [Thermodesulfobacteriota bacterium]
MLSAIQIIAERKIAQAIQNGELQVAGWQNRPLPEENDVEVPPDLRMAYKLLKNAGYLPPEIETRKEIQHLEDLLAATEDEHERLRQMKKLQVLRLKFDTMRPRPLQVGEGDYQRKVVEKISVSARRKPLKV